MREIKFRGFRNYEGNALYPPDKRWIYGYYSFRDGQHWIQDIDDTNDFIEVLEQWFQERLMYDAALDVFVESSVVYVNIQI